MDHNKKLIISESEHNNILSMYNIAVPKRNYIFEVCTTVNGRYFIVQDKVFDIVEQKDLGNIWSSIDMFKNIFQNTILEDTEYTQIRENILSLPILEGKETLYELRNILLEFDFFDDTWVGNQLQKTGQGLSDFAKTSYAGLQKFGVAISQGDWTEILTLLGQGVKYVVRKLKEALYSNVGMIVDAILLATVGGKVAMIIPWALVFALDIYQFINNDWPAEESNNPTWLKLLFAGFDALGLVTTASAAIVARKTMYPLKALNPTELTQAISRNPNIKGILTGILNGLKKVPAMLDSAIKFLSSKFPKGAQFISGILSGLSNVMKRIETIISQLIGVTPAKGVMAGAKTTGLLYGINKATEKVGNNEMGDIESAIKSSNVKPEFDYDDI
jgi:hypothetical protein